MAEKGRARLLIALWVGLGMCLSGVGCQTEQSYSIMSGPLANGGSSGGRYATRQVAYRPGINSSSGIARAT